MDENLKRFATERQIEVLEALEVHGSDRKAAVALGVSKSAVTDSRQAVLRKAARQGYAPEHDYTREVPDGYKLKGVSTLYTKKGVAAQWVKSQIDNDRQQQIFNEALAGFNDQIKRANTTKRPDVVQSHLLSTYPVGDHHFGMLAWGEETGGEDYDLSRGEGLLCRAMDHLVTVTPGSQQAAILLLGDFMHYDGLQPVTPTNGHLLDADSRFPKMVRVAIRSIRYLVQRALEKHEHVKLIVEIGNHDLSSAVFLMEMFAALYEKEDRVDVDNSPRNVHCFEFGKNMIGTHHGHRIKMDDLPGIFANDWPEIWGRTKYRYFHTGHVHHDNVKELIGGVAESHRILAPADAHTSSGPWRSLQSMKAIVYHSDFGEVARHTVNPRMLNLTE